MYIFLMIFAGALPGATLAYYLVWLLMRPKDRISLYQSLGWHLLGIFTSTLGAAGIRMLALWLFGGASLAYDPPATEGIAAFYTLILPAVIAAVYIARLKSKKYLSLEYKHLPQRAPDNHEKQIQTKTTLSVADRIAKIGTLGQTVKYCAKVFHVMKSELQGDDLHAILSATLDFRYATNPTKSNKVRHQHITQILVNSLDSDAAYGLNNLVMAILDQEMDIVGIEQDVEKIVVEVLRESGISYADMHGISDAEQYAGIDETTGKDSSLEPVTANGFDVVKTRAKGIELFFKTVIGVFLIIFSIYGGYAFYEKYQSNQLTEKRAKEVANRVKIEKDKKEAAALRALGRENARKKAEANRKQQEILARKRLFEWQSAMRAAFNAQYVKPEKCKKWDLKELFVECAQHRMTARHEFAKTWEYKK